MKKYWRVGVWVLVAGLYAAIPFRNNWIYWLLGMGLAATILVIDRLLYVWWLKPFDQLSIQIQYWMKRNDLVAVAKLLMERGNEQTKLILRSVGFAAIWPLLMIYMMTSTGSVIALAIVMGLGLELVLALVADWQRPQELGQWWCWQIKRTLSLKEIYGLASGFVGMWVLFAVVLLVK